MPGRPKAFALSYLSKVKEKLNEEENETVTICNGLKMLAPDGEMRMTDVAEGYYFGSY